MNYQSSPSGISTTVYVGFDDQLILFDPSSLMVSFKSVLDWNRNWDATLEDQHRLLVIDSPYALIPESLYIHGMDSLLLQDKYPYLTVSPSRFKVDTWVGHYAKCIYYIPDKYYSGQQRKFKHWLTCLADYNQKFFDTHDTAIWSLRVKSKLYVFVQINRILKEVKIIHAASPDDSTYHLLKIAESYREWQSNFSIWTNENNPLHLNILSQYLPSVFTTDYELPKILHEIIASTCASSQVH